MAKTIFYASSASTLCMRPFRISAAEVAAVIAARKLAESIDLGGLTIALIAGRTTAGRDGRFLLVKGIEQSDAFEVNEVFIIPPEVDTTEVAPLAILERLANRYGVDFSIGDQRERFIVSATVPIASTRTMDLPQLVKIHGPKRNYQVSGAVRIRKGDGTSQVAECALFWVMDIDSYKRAVLP